MATHITVEDEWAPLNKGPQEVHTRVPGPVPRSCHLDTGLNYASPLGR